LILDVSLGVGEQIQSSGSLAATTIDLQVESPLNVRSGMLPHLPAQWSVYTLLSQEDFLNIDADSPQLCLSPHQQGRYLLLREQLSLQINLKGNL